MLSFVHLVACLKRKVYLGWQSLKVHLRIVKYHQNWALYINKVNMYIFCLLQKEKYSLKVAEGNLRLEGTCPRSVMLLHVPVCVSKVKLYWYVLRLPFLYPSRLVL
jgi:hypothetical protein